MVGLALHNAQHRTAQPLGGRQDRREQRDEYREQWLEQNHAGLVGRDLAPVAGTRTNGPRGNSASMAERLGLQDLLDTPLNPSPHPLAPGTTGRAVAKREARIQAQQGLRPDERQRLGHPGVSRFIKPHRADAHRPDTNVDASEVMLDLRHGEQVRQQQFAQLRMLDAG